MFGKDVSLPLGRRSEAIASLEKTIADAEKREKEALGIEKQRMERRIDIPKQIEELALQPILG